MAYMRASRAEQGVTKEAFRNQIWLTICCGRCIPKTKAVSYISIRICISLDIEDAIFNVDSSTNISKPKMLTIALP